MFRFNGKESIDFNIIVTKSNHLSKSKKRVEFISVPGRTGDLIIDEGSRENLPIEIECIIDGTENEDLVERLTAIDNWLSIPGYNLLEFDDGSRFNASFSGEIKGDIIIENLIKTKLTFSCVQI